MKHLLWISILVVSLNVFANDDEKDFSNYKPIDMKQFNKIKMPHKSRPLNSRDFLEASCKTSEGLEMTSSNPGFSNCMRQKANKMK